MAVHLRPTVAADLPQLDGADAPLDDFGPRTPPTTPPPSGLDDAGGMTVVDDAGLVLGNVSWVYMQWGPNQQSRSPVIGIWLASEHRGRGHGSAAQRQLVDLLFRHTTVNRVQAGTDPENLAEQKALERAGFHREAVVRGCQWRDGAYRDSLLYAVLRSDWAAAQA